MARIRINTNSRTKEKPYMINLQFLQNWEGKKSQLGEQNTCLYVKEICAEGIIMSFPWWLIKMLNVGKKKLFLFKRAPFWNLISKKENNYIFQKKII